MITEKRKAQLRNSLSYKRFKDVLNVVQEQPMSVRDVLLAVHHIVDEFRGYGHLWLANYAEEAIQLLLEETLQKEEEILKIKNTKFICELSEILGISYAEVVNLAVYILSFTDNEDVGYYLEGYTKKIKEQVKSNE